MREKVRNGVWVLAMVLFLAPFAAARGADVLERTFAVGPGGNLKVEAAMGSIDVASGASDQVVVRIFRESKSSESDFERELQQYDFQFNQLGNDVEVRVERLSEWNWRSDGNRLQFRFEIEVPYQYNVDLVTAGGSIGVADLEGQVEAKTAGGSLSFGSINGRVRGVTAGGSIELESSRGDAELKTAGGSIRVGRVDGGVEAKTSGGSIEIEEVFGDINASTSGGSVSARISAQPRGDCKLSTSGGNVTVELAEGIGVDVDAATSSGRVHSDWAAGPEADPRRKNVFKGTVGSGGPRLVLRTSGGNIELRRAGR